MKRRTVVVIGTLLLAGGWLVVNSRTIDRTTLAAERKNEEQANKEQDTMKSSSTKAANPESCTCPTRTEAEWKEMLTPMQYHVTREHGTEQAFTGEYWNNHKDGMYRCVCCGAPLFSSETKFESGTGWPSFYEPAGEKNVAEESDNSYFMRRPRSPR